MPREIRPIPYASRRTAVGFLGGFLFALGPLLIGGFLIAVGVVEWPPKTENPALTFTIVASWFVAILFFLSAFTWALFFRCPQCGERTRWLQRVPLDTGKALRFHCAKCDIDWDTGWVEGGTED